MVLSRFEICRFCVGMDFWYLAIRALGRQYVIIKKGGSVIGVKVNSNTTTTQI